MILVLITVAVTLLAVAAFIFGVAMLAGFVVGSLQCARWCVRALQGKREPAPWESERPRANTVPVPAEVRARVMARDGFRCAYCATENDLTVDHLIPRVAGGSNDPENLVTACRSCNSRAGTHGHPVSRSRHHRYERRALLNLWRSERFQSRN